MIARAAEYRRAVAIAVLAAVASSRVATADPQMEGGLLMLRNEHVEVGILAAVGGRVVLLRRPGGENVLFADPQQWTEPPERRPTVDAEAGFRAYNGHITWLGPQRDWWAHQTLNTGRRERRASWPPDPYIVCAPYEVVSASSSNVVLRGPESPVSGVRVGKRIDLGPTGSVRFEATITNLRQEPVAWGIWSNTRLPPEARVYVPILRGQRLRIETQVWDANEFLFFGATNGFFCSRILAGRAPRAAWAKAGLWPETVTMVGFAAGEAFVKRMLPGDGPVHRDHAPVEIYTDLQPDGGGLVELEAHGPYTTLAPGESMSLLETWELIPYAGADTPEAHTRFLERLDVRRVAEPLPVAERQP